MTDPLHDVRFPHRPEHPDFWRMSEVVLQLDGRFEDCETDDEREQVFLTTVAEVVDPDSLFYMASQRAFRAAGVQSAHEAARRLQELSWLTTVFTEAFVAGALYAERGGKQ